MSLIRGMREKAAVYKDHLYYFMSLRKPFWHSIFLLGVPLHGNIGDSAIVIGEEVFLKKAGYLPHIVSRVDQEGYYRDTIRRTIFRGDIVTFHGGGNMGDQWLGEELFRREVLENLGGHKVLVFPQTIYYTDTEQGRRERAASIPYYDRPEVVLVAREQVSYEEMKRLYPKAKVLLTPDIVLSLPMQRFDVPRDRILLCLRSDAEKQLTQAEEDTLQAAAAQSGLEVRRTDMIADRPVTAENRREIVTEKLRSFAAARLVVTDRLHGMIFSAITGTPCVVLSNYNHKVRGTYEWISYLPYIKFAGSAEEAAGYLPELLSMQDCVYDSGPLEPYFQELAQAVRELGR